MKNVIPVICFIVILSIEISGCSLSKRMPKNMPNDFSIIFSYGASQSNHHNKVDTINEILTKDLILDGVATSNIKISEEKMKEIYDLLQNIGVTNYETEYKPPYIDNPVPGQDLFVTPNPEYTLEIVYNGTIYKMHWNDYNNSSAEKAIILRECFKKIVKIIEGTEEFKNLPEPKGGYA